MQRSLCLLLIFLLAACSQQDLMQKIATPKDQADAQYYVDLLRARDFDAIEKSADSSISHAAFESELPKMAAVFPQGDPASIKPDSIKHDSIKPDSITLVGAQRRTINGDASVAMTFEYAFGDKWVLASVTIRDPDGARKLFAFKVNAEHESLQAHNAFRLSGKSPLQYFVLFGTIGAFVLTVWALIACAFTPMLRKARWIVFILLGLCDLGVNWTSGEWYFSPFYVQLFSASFSTSRYGPLLISCSLPLGAILFLLRRRSLRAESTATS